MSETVIKKTFILSTEDNTVFCANGDYCIGYKISYAEKYSQGETDFEQLHSDWGKALRQLPTGTIIMKSDVYTKNEYTGKDLPENTFLQRSARNHFAGREYINHIGYVFFIHSNRSSIKINSLKNPFSFPKLSTFKNEDFERNAFFEAVKNTEAYFSDTILKLIPLTESEFYSLENFYFNGFQNEYTSDLYAENDRLKFDKTNIGVITVNNETKFPHSVFSSIKDNAFSSDDFIFYQGFMDCFGLNLKYNHIYNQLIYLDDNNKHLSEIHGNLDFLEKTKSFSPANASGAKILNRTLDELTDNQDTRLIRGHSNIIYWSDDEEEFLFLKRTLVKNFTNLSFTPNVPTKERLKATFYNSFFTNVSYLDEDSLYIVDLSAATALFINNSNYKNDKKGIVLSERIFNTPVKYDFWEEEKDRSRNFLVVAMTSKGKSFTLNYIINQLIEQDVVVVIIDLGDSYLKLSKLLPPEDIEVFKYKDGEPLGLNPFILDRDVPSSSKIEELAEFVWTLIKKEEEPSDLEQTSMRKIITYYYKMEEDNHSWESFYRFIDKNQNTLYHQLDIDNEEFFKIDEFLHAGSDFVGNGTYSNLLKKTDKSQNFIGKKLIIFELDEVKDNKLLLTILLQVISEAIQKTIWKDRSTKGAILFEEFAKQLEFPNVTKKVKYYTQTIRKYNGSVGLVLQSVNQLPETPDAKSILDNTETFILLESANHIDTINRLALSTHKSNLLNSIKNKYSGEGYRFSEIYCGQRSGRTNVYRIEASPEEFLAFQTKGDLHSKTMEIYNECGSMEETIKRLLKEKKQ